jgi:BTB/POZ domain-containing adapter for CUL3-mediated RhoA degradation protein
MIQFIGWILIDRCGKHFGTILNFLRDGSVPLPQNEVELREIFSEAKFYLVDQLVSQVEALLAKKQQQHDPICRVPLITSTKEERLLVSTANKVSNIIKLYCGSIDFIGLYAVTCYAVTVL